MIAHLRLVPAHTLCWVNADELFNLNGPTSEPVAKGRRNWQRVLTSSGRNRREREIEVESCHLTQSFFDYLASIHTCLDLA